ncbi:MAG: mechanosensitive ion channel [Endomicrobium sp.]|jgi:small-conductance mechanosensitive channel|nr:mechanosensitive ion channel [Endomicrobium sp.]
MINVIYNWFFINKTVLLWGKSITILSLFLFIGFLLKKYVTSILFNIFPKASNFIKSNLVKSYISFLFFLVTLYSSLLNAPININFHIVHKIFYFTVSLSLIILIAYVISKFFSKLFSNRIRPNIIRFIIIFIGLMFLLDQVGVKVKPILFGMCLTSAPMVLAFQDIFVGFYSGVLIFISKQIVKGDYVKLDSGEEGTVIEINWRTTLIKTMSNITIIIPNTKLSSVIVTNFHFNNNSEITSFISCNVAYGYNLAYVERTAIIAAQEVINRYTETVKTYTPIILFTHFGEYAIHFNLFFRIKNMYSKAFIQSEMLKNIYKRFHEAKIVIPYFHHCYRYSKKIDYIK